MNGLNRAGVTNEKALTGFAFPFAIERGGIARAQGIDKVTQNVRHLLSTRLGERTMLRTYGGGLHHQRQEPNNATLRAIITHDIEQALRLYMPEVRITSPIAVYAAGSLLTVSFDYLANPEDTVRRLELQLESGN